jgi:hypothetical protein
VGFGLPEIVVAVLFLGLPIWALIDVTQRPESSFTAQGRSKSLWIVLLLVGIFVTPLGVIATLIYLITIRPKLTKP